MHVLNFFRFLVLALREVEISKIRVYQKYGRIKETPCVFTKTVSNSSAVLCVLNVTNLPINRHKKLNSIHTAFDVKYNRHYPWFIRALGRAPIILFSRWYYIIDQEKQKHIYIGKLQCYCACACACINKCWLQCN